MLYSIDHRLQGLDRRGLLWAGPSSRGCTSGIPPIPAPEGQLHIRQGPLRMEENQGSLCREASPCGTRAQSSRAQSRWNREGAETGEREGVFSSQRGQQKGPRGQKGTLKSLQRLEDPVTGKEVLLEILSLRFAFHDG